MKKTSALLSRIDELTARGFALRWAVTFVAGIGLSGCLSDNKFQWSQDYGVIPAIVEGQESSVRWGEGAYTSQTSLTASWTPSQASNLASQKVQLFSDGNCSTPAAAGIALDSAQVTHYSFSGLIQQTYSFKIFSLDLNGGVLSSTCSPLITVDTTPPVITSVSAPANRAYGVGINLDFVAVFSEAVIATGNSQLTIEVGGLTRNAVYQSGSGTASLTYRYTVQSGEADTDGVGVTSPLDLNGASITDRALNPVSLLTYTPPVTTAVLVDTAAPTITSITPPANLSYKAGSALNFTVGFSKAVSVTGAPRIALELGGAIRYADYQSGSGTKNLVYRYLVTAPDTDTDGIGMTSPVDLNGGSILDAAGNLAVPSYFLPNTSAVLVDTTAPTIVSVTSPSNGSFGTASNLNFTVNFSETVNAGATSRLTLDVGGVTRYASYFSGTGTSAIIYRYSVQSGDVDSDGIGLSSPLDLNGGTIQDLATNDALLTLTAPNLTGVLVDGITPVISSVTPPANGTYNNNQTFYFTVNFSKPIFVNGSPRIQMLVGGVTRYANYCYGSGTASHTYQYTPLAPEMDAAGISVGSAVLLNGGTLKDSASNDAVLSFTALTTSGIKVDTSTPTLTSITPPPNGTYSASGTASLDYTATFSKPVYLSGFSRLKLDVGGVIRFAAYSSGSGTSTLMFRYTVQSEDHDSVGVALSSPLDLNGGRIYDAGSNNALLTFTAPITPGILVVPVIGWSPLAYNFGGVLIGGASEMVTFRLINSGTAVGGCSAPILSDSTSFTITGDQCGTSAMSAYQSCTVYVHANPASGGLKNTTLSRNCTGQTWSTSTNGTTVTGIAPAPALAWAKTAADLGSVRISKSSSTLEMTFRNTGTANAMGCSAATLDNLTDFSIVSQNCGGGQAANTDCSVFVKANPATVGVKSATLSRSCSSGGSASSSLTTNGFNAVPSMIVAGARHTCALMSDQSVQCWGFNGQGQLGDGSYVDHAAPSTVPGLNATAITAGDSHTCAILVGGALKCWGSNLIGQLGDGTTTYRSIPTLVPGVTVSAVAAGLYHTCAVLMNGSVTCWGYNSSGQLGNGTATNTSSPIPVSGLAGLATAVTGGNYHTCALLVNGAVQCWGYNGYGELGNGTSTASTVPASVVSLNATVTRIAAGAHHVCAILQGGGVKCWGSNGSGRLGDGSQTDSYIPKAIPSINVSSISAGATHTCAVLTTSGSVKCWGSNLSAQLGDGTQVNRLSPTLVPGITATTITAGANHTCALTGSTLQCWGLNDSGQLGDNSLPFRTKPIAATGLLTATSGSAGAKHSCAITGSGGVQCWGLNDNGQLGDGTTQSRAAPAPVAGISSATVIASGDYHTCAMIGASGSATIQCWGYGNSGELGNGTYGIALSPVTVIQSTNAILSNVVSLASGSNHSCALVAGGTVQCWGYNGFGQLGDGSTVASSKSVLVKTGTGAPLLGVTAISAGIYHSCSLGTGGTVQCWGYNSSGALGDGTTNSSVTPTLVSGLSGATQITAGGYHTCALHDGTVQCWGNSYYTQSSTPVSVAGISNATQLAGGYAHTCALLSTGSIECWGLNMYGQLGNGGNSTFKDIITSVGSFGTLFSGASANHTCAIRTPSNDLYCWGDNSSSQLGYDETQIRQVSGF